jgi:hypothetical protein
MKVIFSTNQIKIAKSISDLMKIVNVYDKYRNFNNDFMVRGILSEIGIKIMIGLRPSFNVYFDKLGDNGNDVLGFDVKSIMPNHKRLVLFPKEYTKTKGYIVVSLSENLSECVFKGFILSNDFKDKCINEDLGYGLRETLLISNLNDFNTFLKLIKQRNEEYKI